MRLKLSALGVLLALLVIGIGLAIWYSRPPYDINDPKVQEKLSQIEELRQNIREDKNFINAYIQIGYIYGELEDDRRELATYKKLASLRPESSPPFIALGQYYQNKGQYTISEKNFLIAIDNDPSNISIYQDLAFFYTYDLSNREQKFESLMLDAINKQSDIKSDLVHILAFYFKEIGNTEKAINYLTQLIELAPERSNSWQAEIDELTS